MKERGSNIIVSCPICKAQVHMNEMKFDQKGENLVCLECYSHQKSKFKYRVDKHLDEEKPKVATLNVEKTERLKKMSNSEKMHYICAACSYKFSRKKDFPFSGRCPYCGSMKVVVDEYKTSQDILNEI